MPLEYFITLLGVGQTVYDAEGNTGPKPAIAFPPVFLNARHTLSEPEVHAHAKIPKLPFPADGIGKPPRAPQIRFDKKGRELEGNK